ncbi:hypothetical protein [Membranihabitans maritimus]|uniref:hypothetical protein n=1 Tax=Membranihabitans maritimus TaxID=2904244 RepID=UPI001F240FB1|nr:hypothetical protein [Membranihabitans maritimus]
MVKINVPSQCGNAPKIVYLKDFISAIVTFDTNYLQDNTTEDIHWSIVGAQSFTGQSSVLAELQKYRSITVSALTITTIITHGYDGVVEGQLEFENGKKVSFCDIVRFKSSRNYSPVKSIRTHITTLQ